MKVVHSCSSCYVKTLFWQPNKKKEKRKSMIIKFKGKNKCSEF
jgi:hypothetical protein